MIERHLRRVLLSRLSHFPAVAVVGPRQSGKTTLARTLSTVYYDLEVEQDKVKLDLQWDDVIGSRALVVLDEAQNYPGIFPRLRSAIDRERKRNGRFLILGSVSPGLMKQVSESLTGRVAICELSPVSLQEIDAGGADRLWLTGGFPDGGLLQQGRFPIWQKNYLDLMAMRDLPLWGLPAPPQVTQRFFKMLAVSHGNPWNASQVGKSMGLSYHTVNSYLNYLEHAFLIRRLTPYFANMKKRLVKSPKVYWRDSGLLHMLMAISGMEQLLVQPWVGASWEGWVVEQVLTCLNLNDIQHEAYYFRTSDGHELDLVVALSGTLWAFQVKLSSSPAPEDLDRLKRTAELIGAEKKVLISRTMEHIASGDTISTNIAGILDEFSG